MPLQVIDPSVVNSSLLLSRDNSDKLPTLGPEFVQLFFSHHIVALGLHICTPKQFLMMFARVVPSQRDTEEQLLPPEVDPNTSYPS